MENTNRARTAVINNDGHKGVVNHDGEKISPVDINIFDADLSPEQIDDLTDLIGGIDNAETPKKFQEHLSAVFEYEEEHCGRSLPRVVKQFAYQAQTPKQLKRFLWAVPREKLGEYRDDIARIMKIYWAFYRAHEEKDYFNDLDGVEAKFNKSFENIFEKEEVEKKGGGKNVTYFFTDSSGKKVSVHLLRFNKKTIWRAIDKLLRTPGLTLGDVKDILGGRVVLQNEEDKQEFDKFLRNSNFFKNKDYKRKNAGVKVGSDPERQKEIKYVGKTAAREVPFEIQIMTKREYFRSEKHEKHHLVYEFLQNCLRDNRLDTLNSFVIEDKILELARNSDINKGTSVKVVKGKIWDRFGAMFFKYKGEYFAYSHLLRCRHYYLRKRQPELFTALSKHLNRKSGLNLTEERWLGILDDPKNQKEITQFKEIDELFSNITGVAKTVAEYYKQKAAIQIKKRNKKKR